MFLQSKSAFIFSLVLKMIFVWPLCLSDSSTNEEEVGHLIGGVEDLVIVNPSGCMCGPYVKVHAYDINFIFCKQAVSNNAELSSRAPHY